MSDSDSAARLMMFDNATHDDPYVDAWFSSELRQTVRPWFELMRACGPDVQILLHDGHPTACVGGAAFAYVNAFGAHANVGFFFGAFLQDPGGLLEGTGKFMRHAKLKPGESIREEDLRALIRRAYSDIKARLARRQA